MDRIFWISWLVLGALWELTALARMWLNRDPEARTLTQIVEPWIRRSPLTRAIWWIVAILTALHLGTGWF